MIDFYDFDSFYDENNKLTATKEEISYAAEKFRELDNQLNDGEAFIFNIQPATLICIYVELLAKHPDEKEKWGNALKIYLNQKFPGGAENWAKLMNGLRPAD